MLVSTMTFETDTNSIPLNVLQKGSSPTRVKACGRYYWIVCEESKVKSVLVDKCSHMGNSLNSNKSGFSCSYHNWAFDLKGKNFNKNLPNLESVQFSIEEEILKIGDSNISELLPWRGGRLTGEETLRLLSHASFQLISGKVNLVFDPWLCGTTYWGAWGAYPPHEENIMESFHQPSHLIITHPHPDHFHPPTLEKIDRNVKVYFPKFPSSIIREKLKSMEFQNIFEVTWESEIIIGDEVSFAFMRPNYIWEDSAVLVRVKDWLWLNQNDAGAPYRDDLIKSDLDLFSASFDVGASGYPLTWEMSSKKKQKILKNQKIQILENLVARCDSLNARYFAPFASWWRLKLQIHQEFADLIPHILMSDLHESFHQSKTNLLETYPSVEINLKKMTCKPNYRNIESKVKFQTESINLNPFNITDEELEYKLKENLRRLSNQSNAINCEKVIFKVLVTNSNINLSEEFGGDQADRSVAIQVEISRYIAEKLVLDPNFANWSHISIGYWGKWSREPNTYTPNFFRLLQLGYVPEFLQTPNLNENELLKLSLAKIMEVNPDVISRYFSRAGLPCSACKNLQLETLHDALTFHNIEGKRRDDLISELQHLNLF